MFLENAINIFILFFKTGLFCFGGGSTMIGIFEKTLVADLSYLTSAQYADMVAISQITPGPIAINLATYVGAVLGNNFPESFFYSATATIAISLPAFMYVITVAKLFKEFGDSHVVKSVMRGIKPGVISFFTTSLFVLARMTYLHTGPFDYKAAALTASAALVAIKFKINPIFIMLACGFIGVILL